jgi:hypothetical protein
MRNILGSALTKRRARARLQLFAAVTFSRRELTAAVILQRARSQQCSAAPRSLEETRLSQKSQVQPARNS